jgi:hypothetical protein
MGRYTVSFRTDEDSSERGRPGWRVYQVDAKSAKEAIREAFSQIGGLQEVMEKDYVKMHGSYFTGLVEKNYILTGNQGLQQGGTGRAMTNWDFGWDGKSDFRLSKRD